MGKKTWTDAEVEYLKNNRHLSHADASRALGKTLGSVKWKRSYAGLTIRKTCVCCEEPYRPVSGHQILCNQCLSAMSRSESRRYYISEKMGNYTRNAKRRGLSFEITDEEFKELWQEPCAYCGDAIGTIGIDRVDNTGGYTMDNIKPCCYTCNSMKSALTEDAFLDHIAKIGIIQDTVRKGVI